jgi:hypothetical protein
MTKKKEEKGLINMAYVSRILTGGTYILRLPYSGKMYTKAINKVLQTGKVLEDYLLNYDHKAEAKTEEPIEAKAIEEFIPNNLVLVDRSYLEKLQEFYDFYR